MIYYKLGKLNEVVVQEMLQAILLKSEPSKGYHWIEFDDNLNQMWNNIWKNKELKVQRWNDKWIQKAFYSPVGKGWKIHKDGINCKLALNISLQSNDSDWVRWYDEEFINQVANIDMSKGNQGKGHSRNIPIDEYHDLPFIEELKVEDGDVYLVNTDVFHSFYCGGPKDRVIVQTKFEGNPDWDTVLESVKKENFSHQSLVK